jgi:hypothetical protein
MDAIGSLAVVAMVCGTFLQAFKMACKTHYMVSRLRY